MRLDPWQDAARLARALEDDDTELILVLVGLFVLAAVGLIALIVLRRKDR